MIAKKAILDTNPKNMSNRGFFILLPVRLKMSGSITINIANGSIVKYPTILLAMLYSANSSTLFNFSNKITSRY